MERIGIVGDSWAELDTHRVPVVGRAVVLDREASTEIGLDIAVAVAGIEVLGSKYFVIVEGMCLLEASQDRSL